MTLQQISESLLCIIGEIDSGDASLDSVLEKLSLLEQSVNAAAHGYKAATER